MHLTSFYSHQPIVPGLKSTIPSIEALVRLEYGNDEDLVKHYIAAHRAMTRFYPHSNHSQLQPVILIKSEPSPFDLVKKFLVSQYQQDSHMIALEYFCIMDQDRVKQEKLNEDERRYFSLVRWKIDGQRV